MEYTLPSDSTYREDLNFFLKDDEENAQIMKEKMEELQRADRKLREAHAKQNK
jgi:Na+/phosphate symporter